MSALRRLLGTGMREQPLIGQPVLLGSAGYAPQTLSAPRATGARLRVLAWLLTSRLAPWRRWLCRFLLDRNGFQRVRELASQVGRTSRAMYFSARALSARAHAEHARLAAGADGEAALASGWPELARRGGRGGGLAYWTVEDYSAAYRRGALTPVHVARAVLEGARRLDHLGVFEPLEPLAADELLAAAAASAARFRAGAPRSVWDGVPVAVKDSIDVRGLPTTDGAFWTAPCAAADDPSVARLRLAGALVVGKTRLHQLGCAPLGYNAARAGPLNPYDPARYPGGSSSGSAVAVACGLVPLALGTDAGGSIRVPAALCGCVGLCPTASRVPHDSAAARTMTTLRLGPLGGSARDVALAHLLLSHPTAESKRQAGLAGPPPPHAHGLCAVATGARPLAGLRVGVMAAWFDDADADVRAACAAAVDGLLALGATRVDVELCHLDALALAHATIVSAEMAQLQDGVLGGPAARALEPATRLTLALGATVTAVELVAAARLRGWAADQLEAVFAACDVLATPTVGITAPPLSAAARACGESDLRTVLRLMRHAFLCNLLGVPGVSVPVGYGATGLPIGLQLMAGQWEEAVLLRCAHALELYHTVRLRPHPRCFFDVLGRAAELAAAEREATEPPLASPTVPASASSSSSSRLTAGVGGSCVTH